MADGNVQLFATSYGLNEWSANSLYAITDGLSATSAGSETFTTLYQCAAVLATIDNASGSYSTDTVNFSSVVGAANDASANNSGNWRFADVAVQGAMMTVPLPAAA